MTKHRDFAVRGTPVWGLNRFRQYLMAELVDDLEALEKGGLDDAECDHVKDCLGRILAHCRLRSQSGFLEAVLARNLEAFRNAYIQWNGPRGAEPAAIKQRREYLRQLRKRRVQFSHKIGRHQLELSSELDEPFFRELWDAIAEIANRYPGEFARLSRAVRRVRAAA